MKNILIPEKLALKAPKKELLDYINSKKFNDNVLFELNSNFHTIRVVENEIGRFLNYDNTYQAGFINTSFYKGNLPYINYFLISYLINPNIKDILLIGLGSGKIVNDFEFLFDKLKRIDVVDIEENILNIATGCFNFKPTEKFSFILQDGINYLRTNKKKYDLILVDVAGDEGIDLRFLSDEYFSLIKKNLKKSGIFISNMCSSADFENKKNLFFKKYFPIYKNHFKNNLVFKGDYCDKIYYKSFFNLDERVVDITNVIIFSSNKKYEIQKDKEKIEKISKLKVNIEKYIEDLY